MIGGAPATAGTDRRRADGAHEELALRADVEEPGLEAEPDRHAAEDERGGGDDREGDAADAAERALQQVRVGLSGSSRSSSPVSALERMMISAPTMSPPMMATSGMIDSWTKRATRPGRGRARVGDLRRGRHEACSRSVLMLFVASRG